MPVTVLMLSIIGSTICQLFVAVCDRFDLALNLNCDASAQFNQVPQYVSFLLLFVIDFTWH